MVTATCNRSACTTTAPTAALAHQPLFHQHQYTCDRLDAHIENATTAFKKASSWGDFIRSIRGKGDLYPNVGSLNHPAAYLLSRIQKSGTPAVLFAAPWTKAKIEMVLKRGPHKFSHNGIDFLCTEYADMMDKQQWTVVPASMVLIPRAR